VYSLAARPRSPLLASFIQRLHYHENDFPPSLERIVPNGQAHLMINLAEDAFRTYRGAQCAAVDHHAGAVLAGPHAQSTVLDTHEQRRLVAVQFRPGAAGHFFSLPMTEVGDQVVGLEELWGCDGRLMRERLLDAATPEGKFLALEEVLLRHIRPEHDPAVTWAVRALHRGAPVSDVALRLGLLPRTLVRRFAKHVGLTPKRFARVRRLQRLLRSVRASGQADWCALAAEHGYADQAHLVHEFRDLAGITPTSYKPHSPRRNNHIPIAAP
jgi:AraC-like DNA-binding protein